MLFFAIAFCMFACGFCYDAASICEEKCIPLGVDCATGGKKVDLDTWKPDNATFKEFQICFFNCMEMCQYKECRGGKCEVESITLKMFFCYVDCGVNNEDCSLLNGTEEVECSLKESNCLGACRNEPPMTLSMHKCFGECDKKSENCSASNGTECDFNAENCLLGCEGEKPINKTHFKCVDECDKNNDCLTLDGDAQMECKLNNVNCQEACEGNKPITMTQYKCIYPSCQEKMTDCDNEGKELKICNQEFDSCYDKCTEKTP